MTKGKLYLCVVVALILAFSSGCAKNDLVEQDLTALRSQMIEMQRSMADMNLRMEELSNSIFILQERSRANTEAIKQVAQPRIVIQPDSAEGHLVPPITAPLPQGPLSSPNPGTGPLASAIASFREANYGLAVFDFSAFLQKHSTGPDAEQARYYLGMSYFKLNEYSQASREFTRYLSDFPQSARAAETAYMAGLSYKAAGKTEKARTFFELTQQKYPGTPWAQKAAGALSP